MRGETGRGEARRAFILVLSSTTLLAISSRYTMTATRRTSWYSHAAHCASLVLPSQSAPRSKHVVRVLGAPHRTAPHRTIIPARAERYAVLRTRASSVTHCSDPVSEGFAGCRPSAGLCTLLHTPLTHNHLVATTCPHARQGWGRTSTCMAARPTHACYAAATQICVQSRAARNITTPRSSPLETTRPSAHNASA